MASSEFHFSLLFIAMIIASKERNLAQADFITKTPAGFYKCPEDPITEKYPDPTDRYCIHYFLCHRSHAFPARCPDRTVFHPDIRECVPRDRVPESICPNEIECGFNGYYADKKDCTKYYLCFYQSPTHYSCTEDNIFDASKQKCVLNKEKAKSCAKPKPLPQFASLSQLVKASGREG